MKTPAYSITFVLTLLCLSACSKSPTSSNAPVSVYMPLNVGDIRQIIYTKDSSTILWRIVGKTTRQDGYEVFITDHALGTSQPEKQYYCVRDGYFMATLLDSTDDSLIRPTNPFYEQRLARLDPTNGERWNNIIGSTDGSFFAASYFQKKTPLCATFNDVYGFTLIHPDSGALDTLMTVFYADNIGYIGTGGGNNSELDFSVSYLKVGNVELGRLWPVKDPTPSGATTKNMVRTKFLRSLFGIK